MIKFASVLILATLSVLLLTDVVWAQHDENCLDCHSLHYAKTARMLMTNDPDVSINSHTRKPLDGLNSMCMGCHSGDGGPEITIMQTHPVGLTPIKVKVPANRLRDGKITCVGCHDPHPSNTNYKYLLVDTKDGTNMSKLCGICHGDKTEKAAVPTAKK